MKIVCITVGKKHDPSLVHAIEAYEKRLVSFANFEWLFLPSGSSVNDESTTILKQIRVDDYVIALDENGTLITNKALSTKLEDLQNRSTKRLVIIIGGAFGINDAVRQRADSVYSLSKLVFPHQLVRLLLVEQLYRSHSILSGGKYHHE